MAGAWIRQGWGRRGQDRGLAVAGHGSRGKAEQGQERGMAGAGREQGYR
jgi:hypothetical protein